MTPLFSVIIPTHGRPRYLRDAIDSVLAQHVADLEVLVVDDASPTPVEPPEDPRVRSVRSRVNRGPAGARNLGVAEASGRYLAFLDDDDTWTADRLDLALSALERAPVAICWQSSTGQGRELEGDVHDRILDRTTPHLGATAVAADCWVPLREDYRSCEDLLWWLDITSMHAVATTPAQGLHVRVHDGARPGYGTEQRIRDSLRLLDERSEYFAAHPRARAFRWRRIGLMHRSLGQRREARRALLRSLRARPSVASAAHLARTFRP